MPKNKLLLSDVFISKLSIEDKNLLARKNIILGCVYTFFPIIGVFIGALIVGIKGIYAICFFSPLSSFWGVFFLKRFLPPRCNAGGRGKRRMETKAVSPSPPPPAPFSSLSLVAGVLFGIST